MACYQENIKEDFRLSFFFFYYYLSRPNAVPAFYRKIETDAIFTIGVKKVKKQPALHFSSHFKGWLDFVNTFDCNVHCK